MSPRHVVTDIVGRCIDDRPGVAHVGGSGTAECGRGSRENGRAKLALLVPPGAGPEVATLEWWQSQGSGPGAGRRPTVTVVIPAISDSCG
jgi:hypothetical protein